MSERVQTLQHGLRLHRTALRKSLPCGLPEDKFESGYAHLTNAAGEEDKHLFWWFFKARYDPNNAPIVMTLGGGPGASGMLFPFSGAGPCSIFVNENGQGKPIASPYSWTEHVNVLAIDHPVGVGFSYGQHASLRNTSFTAAWDTDDFLQAFWRQYPHLANENSEDAESIMLVNICQYLLIDGYITHFAIVSLKGLCFSMTLLVMDLADRLPECLDSIQYSYQQQTLASKTDAMLKCAYMVGDFWDQFPEHDPYDYRTKCPPEGCDFLGVSPVNDVLSSTDFKDTVGVSREREFKVLALEDIGMPFLDNGYSLPIFLAPVIEDGMRLFVYNGMQDGACPWRSSFAWMRLLETKYQSGFRDAREFEYPGVGSIRQVGPGAGNYTFIKIKEAGHMVIRSQPELLRHLMVQWITNQPFF
ncbi:alpha/beta-hydrolase [Gymnopus androsaceus JB14]|uniref:Alpha/beta-hydrolase n=1 Tax=Gymnopus androsaceus JB14 TaxID=1447944 RepID=A0A6A4HSY9_9AGAR|nr:alpha/beta-hydrolase [Gymnopus androsaceus JB14]